MPNQNYPSDLTDSQWEHIKELLPKAKRHRRPRELEMRYVVNAILYVVVGGIQWRMLPKDFPKWQSVYYYFRLWHKGQEWQRLHDRLRAEVRRTAGRHKHPTAGCLDSQSVKTTQVPGVRGFDAAKNIKGRKRHLLVDTRGLLMSIVVTAASVQERDGARMVFARINGSGKKLRRVWVDGGYRGSSLATWGHDTFSLRLTGGLAWRRTAWLRRAAASLGGGAHLCVAELPSPLEQRLRSVDR